MSGKRSKKSWGDLTTGQQRAIVIAGAGEAVITLVAVRDLVRRPKALVRGPKSLWLPAFMVQPLGPVAYFLFGRKS